MKKVITNIILTIFSFSFLQSCSLEKNSSYQLWYNKPAEKWTEALPVGNGRLGAMVFGKPEKEVVQFNEETLWTGQPHDYVNNGAWQNVDTLRQMLWSGMQGEAHALANQKFMSQPVRQSSYQPFGDLLLNFHGHAVPENYRRELNLDNAIIGVSYDIEGVHFKREIFSSAPDQAIIIHLESSEKGKLAFSGGLDSQHEKSSASVVDNTIILKGKVNNYSKDLDFLGNPYPESELTFEARLVVLENDGVLASTGSTLNFEGATKVTLALFGASSFVNYHDIGANPVLRNEKYIRSISGKPYLLLRKEHIRDYQSFYNRLNIDFGEYEISNRPTDERLNSFYQDNDPSLVALLYQYGRYLLISSSRPGTQPANLQGIWNASLSPAWDSKYTLNINTEMNYWPAEMTNLSDCAEPLLKMIEELAVTGRSIAHEHYNLNGWVAHHNTDIWRGAAPINNSNHGIWVTGGAWLCQHLWWHYQYTGDKQFLKEKAYPILSSASRFFSEYLVPDKSNPKWLVSGPSNSPEQGGLVMGPTMDHQIIRSLFANTIEAAQILNIDNEFVKLLSEKKNRIAPNQIGQYGQLQEWLEDLDDPKNEHRHCSHLWGLYPGDEIHPLISPDLAEACKVTLSHRGDGGTGWSRAWKINFWARLRDGDHSFHLLKNLMVPAGNSPIDYSNKGGLYPNLFDAHPPFQIDGNFGATSGITEMILQSHLKDNEGNYILDILPALPMALPNGKIEGVCARGGFILDIEWQGGKLVDLSIYSKNGGICSVRYRTIEKRLNTKKNKTYSVKF